ncbi:MAG TPA: pyruvate kinase [Leeuwenhoekiella sp.]|nr:pyruvate kinase [Leeuwenhoekiella sp.]|tara:strand:+ start:3273 stop:4670 length:1398 start_codon:yes stop_codon:yes gene_type:complete
MNKTKIIATIGPSCSDKKLLQEMVNGGVGTFRINMSHGDAQSKKRLFELVKSVSHPEGGHPAILTDLCGPKIRIVDISDNLKLEDGDTVVISNKEGVGDIFVTSSISLSNVKTGSKILINDGKVQLDVSEVIDENTLRCETLIGGEIQKGKGVNFPGVSLGVPALTSQDKEDLKLALKEGSDWIALSFVRNASDVDEVHAIMDDFNMRLPVMAKIEKWEALEDLANIINTFDGVMVARGDLGVEIPSGKVPAAQKEIISLASANGKPVVIATQLLESMVDSHTPTRAEVSDISNSVFDGVDCLMVTGETAIGKYPVEVIKTLNQVITETEGSKIANKNKLPEQVSKTADAISHAVCQISDDLKIKVIMTMTHSGSTARMISSYRPKSSIFALTPFSKIVRQLQLVWGVQPIKVDNYDNIDNIPNLCNKILKHISVIDLNEQFVITGGVPMGIAGTTNYLSIQVYS